MFGLPYMVDWRSSPQHSKSEIIGGDGVFPLLPVICCWLGCNLTGRGFSAAAAI
jgi:hypothetical protein